MNKCNHNKKCFQCVQEEIKELERKLQELKDLLPKENTIYIPYSPNIIPNYPVIWCGSSGAQDSKFSVSSMRNYNHNMLEAG